MKNLKTFETFFNFYRYSTIKDTKELWGYNREDIEDLFVEFNDKYDLPISITFTKGNKKLKATVYSVGDTDIKELKRDVNFVPKIEITVFTNPKWCNKFCGEDIDFPVHFINGEYHEDLGKKMHDGFSKIADDIESMLPQIKKRMPDYNFKTVRTLDISNRWGVHPSGVEYGEAFFSIFLEKSNSGEGR